MFACTCKVDDHLAERVLQQSLCYCGVFSDLCCTDCTVLGRLLISLDVSVRYYCKKRWPVRVWAEKKRSVEKTTAADLLSTLALDCKFDKEQQSVSMIIKLKRASGKEKSSSNPWLLTFLFDLNIITICTLSKKCTPGASVLRCVLVFSPFSLHI